MHHTCFSDQLLFKYKKAYYMCESIKFKGRPIKMFPEQPCSKASMLWYPDLSPSLVCIGISRACPTCYNEELLNKSVYFLSICVLHIIISDHQLPSKTFKRSTKNKLTCWVQFPWVLQAKNVKQMIIITSNFVGKIPVSSPLLTKNFFSVVALFSPPYH